MYSVIFSVSSAWVGRLPCTLSFASYHREKCTPEGEIHKDGARGINEQWLTVQQKLYSIVGLTLAAYVWTSQSTIQATPIRAA